MSQPVSVPLIVVRRPFFSPPGSWSRPRVSCSPILFHGSPRSARTALDVRPCPPAGLTVGAGVFDRGGRIRIGFRLSGQGVPAIMTSPTFDHSSNQLGLGRTPPPPGHCPAVRSARRSARKIARRSQSAAHVPFRVAAPSIRARAEVQVQKVGTPTCTTRRFPSR